MLRYSNMLRAAAFFLFAVLAIYFSGTSRAQIATKSEGRVSVVSESKAAERSTASDSRISSPQTNSWVNNQNASVVLGQAVFNTNASGAGLNQMSGPAGVTVDATTGKVFVADFSNNRVLRFSSAAAAANGSSAEASFGGTGATSATTMSGPIDVTIDTSGNLWVADLLNNRVLRFGGAATLASGSPADRVLGQTLFTTSANPNPPTAGSMNFPEGVFADAGGRLWVADRDNDRVLRFDAAAGLASGAPANGVLGQVFFTTNAAAASQIGMNFPVGVTVDSGGRLWVADGNNNRVLRFDNAATLGNGAPANGVLGQTTFFTSTAANPPTAGSMTFPIGVSVDSSGRLYVGDQQNNRVLIFNAAAGKANGANADNVLGQPGFITNTANSGGLSASSLNSPGHLFFDNASQNLFVAELGNNRVLRFAPAGPIVTNWVNNQNASVVLGQAVFNTNSSGAGLNQMSGPAGVTVDAATGKVFVADWSNNRVLRFSSAAAMTNGSSAEASFGGTDATAANTMNSPADVTIDTSGNLWVADFNNNRVLRFGGAAALASGSPADRVLGQTLFTTNAFPSPPTASSMNLPEGVFADAGGHLWVADRLNARVLRFDNAATLASGASANGVLGQPGFITSAPATTQTGMNFPIGVTVDSGGRLWVADANNNRVLRFEKAATLANGANASGVLGQTLFTTSTAANPPTAGSMKFPIGVSTDSSGRLYVGDEQNNRVLIFNAAAGTANGVNADNVLGQPGFITNTANSGGLSASSLNSPGHLFFDNASQNLFVAELGNNRVLRFGPAGSTAAGVSVSGRVLTPDGRGLRNAYVVLTDQHGVTRTVTTGAFGNYQFDDVQSGEAYVIGVVSKRYRFASRVLQVFDTVTGEDFTGDE